MSSQHQSSIEPFKQNILEKAHRFISENGTVDFTMDELAEVCGISRATLYRRAGSRETILKDLAAEYDLQIEEIDAPDIKTRILQATRTTLSKTGSLNFTIEQVAQEADLGVATIYRHFGSKTGLIEELSNQIHPRRAALKLIDQQTNDLKADLERFATNALGFMIANRDLATFYFSSNTNIQDIFQSLRGDQNRTINTLSVYLQQKIDAGQIPAQNAFDLAAAFVGMIVGFAFIKPSYTDELDQPEEIAERVVHLFLNGILEKDSP